MGLKGLPSRKLFLCDELFQTGASSEAESSNRYSCGMEQCASSMSDCFTSQHHMSQTPGALGQSFAVRESVLIGQERGLDKAFQSARSRGTRRCSPRGSWVAMPAVPSFGLFTMLLRGLTWQKRGQLRAFAGRASQGRFACPVQVLKHRLSQRIIPGRAQSKHAIEFQSTPARSTRYHLVGRILRHPFSASWPN